MQSAESHLRKFEITYKVPKLMFTNFTIPDVHCVRISYKMTKRENRKFVALSEHNPVETGGQILHDIAAGVEAI